MLLLSEVAAFSQTGLTTSWSAEDHVASGANSSDLGVREDGLKIIDQHIQKITKFQIFEIIHQTYLDFIASRAFYVHEIGVWRLN